MYALALKLSAAAAAGASIPHSSLFHLGPLSDSIPIQAFGVIVAAGVLIGASLLRRYAEWHGVKDDHIRGLTGWVTVCGFLGAHLFDVLAYNWQKFQAEPILLVKLWDGISSYGGFIGGAIGFAFYVWWKRLPVRLFADITIVGLLPAFSIGRIGCTVVSDHIGALVDPSKWYAFLAVDYTREELGQHFADLPAGMYPAWNLGLVEFLYLVPVNALILWLAFRSSKRLNAGLLVAITGVLYAPVRFFLDFLRPEDSDPRYFGLTFAQWASFVAFAAAAALAVRIFQNGKPAETVRKTSGEVQRMLKELTLKDDAKSEADEAESDAEAETKKAKKR